MLRANADCHQQKLITLANLVKRMQEDSDSAIVVLNDKIHHLSTAFGGKQLDQGVNQMTHSMSAISTISRTI